MCLQSPHPNQTNLLNEAQNTMKDATGLFEFGQHLNSVFTELSKQQVEVVSMRNKTGRLEELFLNVVVTG